MVVIVAADELRILLSERQPCSPVSVFTTHRVPALHCAASARSRARRGREKNTYTTPVRAALRARPTLHGVSPLPLPNPPPQRSTHTSARAALAPNLALAPAGAAVVRAEIDTGPARAAPQAWVAAAGTAVALRGRADLSCEQCGELGSGVEVEVGL